MAAAVDWSLDPRVRKLFGGLPLPIKLPTPLQRGTEPGTERGIARGGHRLDDRRAVLLRLRDAADTALAEMLIGQGAALTVADRWVDPALLSRFAALGAKIASPQADVPATIAANSAAGDRRPLLLVARVDAVADANGCVANLANNEAGDLLLQVGQALALAPPHSRLCLIVPEPADASAAQTVLAAAAGGLVRSLHKETGPAATTCHLLRLAGASPRAVADAVGFLVSPSAAFLTGLDVRLGPDVGPAVEAPNRVALVTGAARGIGAAVAQRMAQSGCTVLVNDIAAAQAAGEATVQAIIGAGGQARFVAGDCSSAAGAQAMARAVEECGRLDAVVHNAGITRDRTLKRMAPEQWRQVLAVNLAAMENVQTAVEAHLQPGAAMAMLSSVMGIAGNFGQCNYTAAKAGVLALMRLWAAKYAPLGVRCNAIAPGFIATDMTAQVPLFNREMAKQLTALLQPGLPEDVAELAAFLCHPASRAITGQTLRCDGGMAFGA